ncbi:MAG: pilus assembly protein TadG-related protein [Stenotrophomonas maltophilia]
MKRPRQFSFGRPRGGMSVTMMLVMLALLAMLGLVEIGYLFWAKRDAQKVADLAALAGAQRLELCTSDNSDNSAARQSAVTQNRFAGTVQIRCGNWSATRSTSRTASSPPSMPATRAMPCRWSRSAACCRSSARTPACPPSAWRP